MTDIFLVHVIESIKYLFYEMFDLGQGDGFFGFFSYSQLIFKTALTVLHHDVLNQSLLLIERVEKLNQLDNIRLSLKQAHHFVLARDNIASLLSPLDGHFHVSVQVECLEDKTYTFKLEMMLADAISVDVF